MRGTINAIVGIVALVVAFVFISPPVGSTDSVVSVLQFGGGQWHEIGSGSASGNGYVVTAAHVVSDRPAIGDHWLVKAVDGRRLKARVVAYDKERDIAILELAGHPDVPTAPLLCEDAPVGTGITARGYPLGFGLVTTFGHLARGDTGALGTLGPYGQSSPWPNFFLLDVMISYGNSGGPVYDQNGRVVAFIVGLLSSPYNFTIAVPARVACELIASLTLAT